MSNKIDFSKRIFVGLTGGENKDWQVKLEEINRFRIKEVAVFLERFDKKERDNFYKFLSKSCVRKVPLVHLRDDTDAKDIKFFIEDYKTRYFNIHEDHFNILDNWKGYWKNIYLEMNYDNEVAKDVKVRKIGGFCIDLSHMKCAIARGGEEAYYAYLHKNKVKFSCNHLNGYSPRKNCDLHTIRSLKDFDYLTTLPKFIFGKIIVLEVENNIEEQLKFKEYLVKMLNRYFNQ